MSPSPAVDGGRPVVRPLWLQTVEIDDDEAAAVTPSGELCWLTSEQELAGWGAAVRVAVGDGPGRFLRAAAALDRHVAALDVTTATPREARPAAFCSFTFDPRNADSVMVVPRTLVRRRGGRAWVTAISERPISADDVRLPRVAAPRGVGRVRYAGTTATEIGWIDAVDRAVRRIRAREAQKVVLARDRMVYSDAPFDPAALLTHLREAFPTCSTFHVAGLVGASPELLIRRDGAQVASLVLAGTTSRGRDAAHDAELGAALLGSSKDLAEHRPAVASVRDALEPLVERLDVDAEPHLLRLANVQHLATGVSGTLRAPVHALDLAGRLHPTAAVGGMPRDVALAMITELEAIDRARYAAPVGWVDAAGDGELAIALRCAQLMGARARLFAGAGIVADSLPESELEETRLKLRAMQSAFEARQQ
jgi:menaquinone-specific isochorismate synthase